MFNRESTACMMNAGDATLEVIIHLLIYLTNVFSAPAIVVSTVVKYYSQIHTFKINLVVGVFTSRTKKKEKKNSPKWVFFNPLVN